MTYSILLVIAGLVLLTLGAEGLVRSGSSLALRLGVSRLVVGLTIVALGTSSPELVVSAEAAWIGSSSLALGNVVGSNISNTALILGAAAIVYPLKAKVVVVRREMPIMIAITGILWLMLLDGELGRLDGGILTSGVVVYTIFVYLMARKDREAEIHESISSAVAKPTKHVGLDIAFLISWQRQSVGMKCYLLIAGVKWSPIWIRPVNSVVPTILNPLLALPVLVSGVRYSIQVSILVTSTFKADH